MRFFTNKSRTLKYRVHPDGKVEIQDQGDPGLNWKPALSKLSDLIVDRIETDERGNALPQPLDLQPCTDH